MMVTRTNPFDSTNYDQLIQNNLKGTVDLNPLLSATLKVKEDGSLEPLHEVIQLIAMMLMVDPKQRPSAGQLLNHFTQTFLV